VQRTIRHAGLPWVPPATVGPQLAIFASIGAVSTAAYALLYNLVRGGLEPLPANAVALGITMIFNFAANRQVTFGRARGGLGVHASGYAAVYFIGLAASTLALDAALRVITEPSRAGETMLAIAAGTVATLVRFVGLKRWVFRVS